MDELVVFLKVRWHEAAERAAFLRTLSTVLPPGTCSYLIEVADDIDRDIAAKRRILDEYAEALRVRDGFRETGWEEGRREALELACKALAAPRADHPDYQERWKP